MNAQPSYKSVAFFMLAKRPSTPLPPTTQATLSNRLYAMALPLEQMNFGEVTAQGDVDEFYQCLAHSLTAGAAWRENWIQLEIKYLACKLQCYYAHLGALCKAEGVHLKRANPRWEVKFPWEEEPGILQVPLGSNEIQVLAARAFAPLHNEMAARQLLNSRLAPY